MNEVTGRYTGLLELIEEFEHLAMAMEDEDEAAISYFERQKGFLLNQSALNEKRDTPDGEETTPEHSEHHL